MYERKRALTIKMAAPIFLNKLTRAPSKLARSNPNQTIYARSNLCELFFRRLHIRRNAVIHKFPPISMKNSRFNYNVGGVFSTCCLRMPRASVPTSPSTFLPTSILSYSISASSACPTIKLSPALCRDVLCGRGSLGRRGYCAVSRSCWSCNAQSKPAVKSNVLFFCGVCNAIQPVDPDFNYFQVMQCDETFDLDTPQLTQTFRNLQRKLHPDKFSIMSKEEQDYSAMQSSEVNKAYSTLLKPLSRGLYLLELNGLTIEEGEAGIEVEFLMEVMETNEVLADTGDEVTIRRLGQENAVKLEAALKDLSHAFSKKNYPQAREVLMRLKYFANIDDKVKEKLEKEFS